MEQQQVPTEQYAERISAVYAAIASVKSARDCEQCAELMRLHTAIERLIRSRLRRANPVLSSRAGDAVKSAYQAVSSANRKSVDLADVGLGLCNQLSLACRAEAAIAGDA